MSLVVGVCAVHIHSRIVADRRSSIVTVWRVLVFLLRVECDARTEQKKSSLVRKMHCARCAKGTSSRLKIDESTQRILRLAIDCVVLKTHLSSDPAGRRR